MPPRVLHLNYSVPEGGAARAALRIHQSLMNHGIESGWQSSFRAIEGQSTDFEMRVSPVIDQSRVWRQLRPYLGRLRRRNWNTSNPVIHSIAWPDTGLGSELQELFANDSFDLLNLHWLGDNTLSIEEIGRLSMPMVCTMHDQWYFLGSEHYICSNDSNDHSSSQKRYCLGYSPQSCPTVERKCDLNRWTWLRKKHFWLNPFTLVAPSKWMGDCARKSFLMSDWPCHVIPNPIDLDKWFPLDKNLARQILGLPITHPLILFGAIGGSKDPRKGADLLISALHLMAVNCNEFDNPPQLIVFGESFNPLIMDIGLQAHFLGPLHDDVALRLAYSAADVMVVPSRLDNLPNTATEAMACGTPVVAFRVGGLPEIIDHEVTGMLCEPFSVNDLAQSIQCLLSDADRLKAMSHASREKAVHSWSPARIASLYASVYDEVINDFAQRG